MSKAKKTDRNGKKGNGTALLIGAVFFVIAVLWLLPAGKPVKVSEEKNGFVSRTEAGAYTELRYRVTVKNASRTEKRFTLSGTFPEEGVYPVNETGMIGLDEESASSVFRLKGGEEKTFSVLFVGGTKEGWEQGSFPLPEFTVTVLD